MVAIPVSNRCRLSSTVLYLIALVGIASLIPTTSSVGHAGIASSATGTQDRSPSTDTARLLIGVTHFENDPDTSHEKVILDALNGLEGIKVIRLDETLSPGKKYTDPGARESRLAAQQLVEKSGVFVLIWGAVEGVGGKTFPNIQWTETSRADRRREAGGMPAGESTALPRVPWSVVGDVLRLIAFSAIGEFTVFEPPYTKDPTDPLFDHLRRIIAGADSLGLDPESRLTVIDMLGMSLLKYGMRGRLPAFLKESALVDDYLLQIATREQAPSLWARLQQNKGTALLWLGRVQADSSQPLADASMAFRSALTVVTRESDPRGWALIQSSLGSALSQMAFRVPIQKDLDDAVSACQLALQVLSRDSFPVDWAVTQNALGDAYMAYGSIWGVRNSPAKAISAYQAALQVFTFQWTPLDWAEAQNNLGMALRKQAEFEAYAGRWSPGLLTQAVDAHRRAIQFFGRNPASADYGSTEYRLGQALYDLSRILTIQGDSRALDTLLKESISVYFVSLKVFTLERTPLLWIGVQRALGDAYLDLGQVESNTGLREKAIDAYQSALRGFPLRADSSWWADTQVRLAEAHSALLPQDTASLHAKAAVTAYRAALTVITVGRNPYKWATIQYNLGMKLLRLWADTSDPSKLCEAFNCQLLAWDAFERSRLPWAANSASMIRKLRGEMDHRFQSGEFEECTQPNRPLYDRFTERQKDAQNAPTVDTPALPEIPSPFFPR